MLLYFYMQNNICIFDDLHKNLINLYLLLWNIFDYKSSKQINLYKIL